MITISNCPITGLKRKLTYDFYWLQSQSKIVIMCYIHHYNDEDVLISNARIVSYQKALTASDSLVDPMTGHIYTPEELLTEPESISEYEFYVSVLGVTPLILPSLIESIIQARDLEGKFNI